MLTVGSSGAVAARHASEGLTWAKAKKTHAERSLHWAFGSPKAVNNDLASWSFCSCFFVNFTLIMRYWSYLHAHSLPREWNEQYHQAHSGEVSSFFVFVRLFFSPDSMRGISSPESP